MAIDSNAKPTEVCSVSDGEAAQEPQPNPVKRFLKMLGPGLVTGASDDDPSGIGTYAVAGAQLGYAVLWTALLTFPLMTATNFISAKIGLVTGRGLAALLREHYPRWLLYPVVLAVAATNAVNAGADIAVEHTALGGELHGRDVPPLGQPLGQPVRERLRQPRPGPAPIHEDTSSEPGAGTVRAAPSEQDASPPRIGRADRRGTPSAPA